MDLKKLLADPLVKTIVTNGVAAAVATLDAAVQNGPTGGSAVYLAAHPNVAIAYMLGLSLMHNFLSKYAPPTTVVTKNTKGP